MPLASHFRLDKNNKRKCLFNNTKSVKAGIFGNHLFKSKSDAQRLELAVIDIFKVGVA
jgi:hypothetical protein